MIDITDQVVAMMGRIPAVGGRAYRQYPQARPRGPYVVVTPTGGVPELTDGEGSAIISHQTFTIDILADSPRGVDHILSAAADRLCRINIHLTGRSPMFEGDTGLFRISATFDGMVDRRGHTFR